MCVCLFLFFVFLFLFLFFEMLGLLKRLKYETTTKKPCSENPQRLKRPAAGAAGAAAKREN
jgi:hypothetical protein